MNRILLDGGGAAPSILVDGPRIVSVRSGGIESDGADRLDCTGARVSIAPGEVNAHTHLYSGLAPLGMPAPAPPPENFLQILERVWWRLDRALDEASLRASARLYMAEALLAGTTTLVDHHESPAFIDGSLDVLGDAAQELGIRLVACYGATERNDGPAEARRGLAECRRFAAANDRLLVRAMVGLHASFTMSDETLREAGALARELALPVHVHVAEDAADVEDAKRRGYEGPLQRLLALNALPEGSILAHGVHLDEAMVKKAAEASCWLVQNPRSNEGNKVGYPHALAATRRVALGTDGYPADMPAERAALIESAAENHDSFFADPDMVRERHQGGWRIAADVYHAAFLPPPGPGAAADLIVLDSSITAEDGSTRPRHVLAGGRVVVRDGVLVTGDIDEIRAHAREQAAELWKRMIRL